MSYSRVMRRTSAIFALALLFTAVLCLTVSLPVFSSFFGLFGGSKQQQPPGWMLHKQTVSLDASAFKGAEQPCENWSWVAGITDMAAANGAQLTQQYLVDRLYGGSVCLQS